MRWYFIVLLFGRFIGFAQSQVVVLPSTEAYRFQKINWQDSVDTRKKIQEVVQKAVEEGWLEFSVDSVQIKKDTVCVKVWRGKKYVFMPLQYQNVSEKEQKKLPNLQKPTFSPLLIKKKLEEVNQFYLQQGYAFAHSSISYRQDSTQKDFIRYYPRVMLYPEEQYRLDSVYIQGKTQAKPDLILHLAQLHRGELFNQKKIDNLPKRLRNTPYFQSVSVKDILFTAQQKTILTLLVEDKKANYVDGIIGIAPQQNKTQVTGTAKLHLVSTAWGGKILTAQWDKLQSTSQNLSIELTQPRLFKLPFALYGKLWVNRQDSTFLRRDLQANISYHIEGGWDLYFSVFQRNSYALTQNGFKRDTLLLAPTPKLLTNLAFNFKQLFYGIGLKYNLVNNLYCPTRGQEGELFAQFGNKNLRATQGIDERIFNTLSKKTISYNLHAHYWQYYTLKKRQIGVLGVRAATIDNAYLAINDLYRLGGLKTLRGFNEQQFFATNYVIATAEYRYLVEEESFLSVFIDQGWLQETYQTAFLTSQPIEINQEIRYETIQTLNKVQKLHQVTGFGVGMQLALEKIGLLSLAIAMGKEQNSNLQAQRIRLHFGIIARF